jgi:hypothetical protein
MALDLSSCTFLGPALPEPFVRFDLDGELNRKRLLPKATGDEGRELQRRWDAYRRRLRELIATGGPVRVRNQVIEPLASLLGYERLESADKVLTREETREGEDGGYRLIGEGGNPSLRVWTTDFNADLDAPARRGAAYRYSHLRVAQRVLLASGERVGLLTNGVQLRILLSDPARPDSQVVIPIDPEWKRSRNVPDSFRFLLALCRPSGVRFVPELVDKARLKQARVTKELRVQARQAIEGFVQEVLDHPDNREAIGEHTDRAALARQLWREGLVLIYRLLFVLKGEANDDPARCFGFASTSLWRNTYSPSLALAPFARRVLDDGAETGHLLEAGLRSLFRLFTDGLECTELRVKPLGGALFGTEATPLLSRLHWGERAAAHLLDHLLWTTAGRGRQSRERVHYGPLDVEDLGRVYEALLELEPGISDQPMCRLRRAKLEVVVPEAQGERYRAQTASPTSDEDGSEDSEGEATEAGRGRTRVEWVEAIPPGKFHLRVGLGRKASGSYYTPHPFVRFLVQETLGPQVAERCPKDDPNPAEILKLKVLDPAMGSGHFLVETCRFLGDALYEACYACDEKATAAERRAESAAERNDEAAFKAAAAEMDDYRRRIADLPDPEDELLQYLPSRAPEGEESGYSRARAHAICRRLVACHCLYGVDKNPLAVELAKLSLWLESQAEGLPLTFLDHRLVVGDSLTGPFWDRLVLYPGAQQPLAELWAQDLDRKFAQGLQQAIRHVTRLQASVGANQSEIEEKQNAKRDLDRALVPFSVVAAAWSGGVALGPGACDDFAYEALLRSVAETGDLPERIESEQLRAMVAKGLGLDEVPADREGLYRRVVAEPHVPAVAYDLTFPEVFYPHGVPHGPRGFHAVVGNPPWRKSQLTEADFMAAFDFRWTEAETPGEKDALHTEFRSRPEWSLWEQAQLEEAMIERAILHLSPDSFQEGAQFGGGDMDVFAPFVDRALSFVERSGMVGLMVPHAFHSSNTLSKLRRKVLYEHRLVCYFCFENRRKLFEIDGRWKYTPMVAAADAAGNERFEAMFYLTDPNWLFAESREHEPYDYQRVAIERKDPEGLTFTEYSRPEYAAIEQAILARADRSFREVCRDKHILLGRELHSTQDRWRLVSIAPGERHRLHPADRHADTGLLVYKVGNMHAYTDAWGGGPEAAVPLDRLGDKPRVLQLARYCRLAYRLQARATDERTSIVCLLPPGCTATHTMNIEKLPDERPSATALRAMAVMNSFVFDFLLRLNVAGMYVSQSLMERVPWPAETEGRAKFTAHCALRLTCNHPGYRHLWQEQLAETWREPGKEQLSWPVLPTEAERWEARSAIDALVAQAYGLSREQYEHVLRSFDRASGPNPHTDICLAKFDELNLIGLDAFTRKYDPYWDIPLVETLPEPVIELPIPRDESSPSTPPTNLLGEPLPTNLLGEVVIPKRKQGRRTRKR